MYNGKSFLAIIPARGGSKRLPRKHTRFAKGIPLIAWTINTAKKSRYLDKIIVSSDCPEIISTAIFYGCEAPYVRPAHLATDKASSMSVILHALEEIKGYDFVVLLQPTSPLRNSQDIDTCIQLCSVKDVKACVSLTLAKENPYWMFYQTETGGIEKIVKKTSSSLSNQETLPSYILNGAVYVACVSWLKKHKSFYSPRTVAHLMPDVRSIDIDTEEDFSRFLDLTKELKI